MTQSPEAGTAITENTMVTLTASDASGNSTSCSFMVEVDDSGCCEFSFTCADLNADGPIEILTGQDGIECGSALPQLPMDEVFTDYTFCENELVIFSLQGGTNSCEGTPMFSRYTIIDDINQNGSWDFATEPVLGRCQVNYIKKTGPGTPAPDQEFNISCADDIPASGIQFFTNECGVTEEISTFEDEVLEPSCDDAFTLKRVWSYTNSCGNVITTTYTYNVSPICEDLSVAITQSDNSICDGPITLTATPSHASCGEDGLDGVSYLWTPGGATTASIEVTDLGMYSVEITTCSGCTASAEVDVILTDNVPLDAVCTSFEAVINESGMAIVNPEDIDGGSTDNCGDVTLSILGSSETSTLSHTNISTHFNNIGHGQSFIPTTTGVITEIRVKVYTTIIRDIFLYNSATGSGTAFAAGTPDYIEPNVTLTGDVTAGTWASIPLSTPFPVVAGNSYSFVIDGISDIWYNQADTYPDGAFIFGYDLTSGCCAGGRYCLSGRYYY